MIRVFSVGLWFALSVSGCGDDGGTATDGGIDGGGTDAAGADCTGMADGSVCAEGSICLAEICVASRCGDGFIDETATEQCDDGNEASGDGCEPSSCVFSCVEASGCDDGDPCNGAETCNETAHRCQASEPPTTATACMREGGEAGVCSGGLCADPGCGNGTVEDGEDCDDMNDVQTDGCKTDCTFTCTTDEECQNADACDGAEVCDVDGDHTCGPGPVPDCNDGDECTADACDMEMGCTNTLVDLDMDGFAPADSCTTSGLSGGDCDDRNGTVFPGAAELCDGVDNDCDGTPDDGTVDVECRVDRDEDGYGSTARPVTACSCPAGTIPPRSDGELDCFDSRDDVNPGITAFRTGRLCTRCGPTQLPYDWNCDGVEERQYTVPNSTGCFSRVGSLCGGTGWRDTVPRCGQAGVLRKCGLRATGTILTCQQTFFGLDVQPCR